ncbi:hypothetical protein CT0861_12842, partial [Colletotrichum tofieldiae]
PPHPESSHQSQLSCHPTQRNPHLLHLEPSSPLELPKSLLIPHTQTSRNVPHSSPPFRGRRYARHPSRRPAVRSPRPEIPRRAPFCLPRRPQGHLRPHVLCRYRPEPAGGRGPHHRSAPGFRQGQRPGQHQAQRALRQRPWPGQLGHRRGRHGH